MPTFQRLALLVARFGVPGLALADTSLSVDGAIGRASVDDGGIRRQRPWPRCGLAFPQEHFGAEVAYAGLGEVGEEVAIGGATASIDVDGFYAGV